MPQARALNQTDLVLECRLLGAPQLLLNNAELDVRYRKVIALIAFLALEGATSRAKLAGLLWSEVTDDAARRNLRRELHRLKNDLPVLNERLEVSENSLQLRAPFQCDVVLFEQAISAGHVEQALEFYHGSLLQSLELEGAGEFHEWLEQKRERLERSRRRAMLECAELLETRGDWHKALEIHHGLLELDPFQERTHRDLMRLYFLMGEREAALTQFEKCQTMLETELGLEPLPETLELALSIRASQPPEPLSRVLPKSSSSPILPTKVPLIGRSKVWVDLENACEAGQLALLVGEPGVGKTRLMLEFASARGLRIGLFEARPGDALVAFSTVSRMLRCRFSVQSPDSLEPWVQAELSRLLPEWGLEPPPLAPNEGRLRLFQAVAQVLLENPENTVAIADDIQFFDTQSLELMAFIATKAFEHGVRRVSLAAYRLGELNPEAEHLIAEHVRSGMAVQINLAALTETDLLELVQKLSGVNDSEQFSKRLHKSTGGNPFFALETIKTLLESGILQRDGNGVWLAPNTINDAELPVPKNVREAVLARVKQLGEQPRRLLEAASLTIDGFDLETLRGATALSDWEGLEALEVALTARIVEPFQDGYRFSHDLMRSSIEGNLSLERKKLLHQKLAISLEKLGASAARIADHLEQAGRAIQAVPWRVKAALEASMVYANQDALEQYSKARQDGATGKDLFEIYRAQLQILESLGQERQSTLQAMNDIAQSLKDARLQISADLYLAQFFNQERQHQQAIQTINGLLTQTLNSPELAWALLERGHGLFRIGQLKAGKNDLLLALEHQPEFQMQGDIHGNLRVIALYEGDFVTAEDHARLGLAMFEQSGNQIGKLEATTAFARIASGRGDTLGAIQTLQGSLELAQKIGHAPEQLFALTWLAYNHLRLGHLEETKNEIDLGLKIAEQIKDTLWGISLLHLQSRLQMICGEFGQAFNTGSRALLEAQKVGVASEIISLRCLAQVLFELGDVLEAKALYQQGLQLAVPTGNTAYICLLEVGLIRCALEIQDLETAERHLQLALAHIAQADAIDKDDLLFVQVRILLAQGQATQAKALLEPMRTTLFPENSLRFLTLELKVCGQLNLKANLEPAFKALENHSPSPANLELRRAMLHALESGEPRKRKLQESTKTLILEMKASLEEFSELQQRFFEKNHDLTAF